MLKIDRENQTLTPISVKSLADAEITERYELQEFIASSPREFFRELGQDLFLIGTEICPSAHVQDRIDLLAVAKDGATVIVELKRGNNKLQQLQAISYASMLAQWSPDDFFDFLTDAQGEELIDFLDVERDDLNRSQRILLIAEGFDYALLMGAEWLCERYGLDITCCRIALSNDELTNSEYLVCSNVYPAPELSKEAVRRGRLAGPRAPLAWSNWEAALAKVTNEAVVDFFKTELGNGQEAYLPKRALRYRIGGKRRWGLQARSEKAYVWQRGRFRGDIDFWKSKLSTPEEIKPVDKGSSLRLMLFNQSDFQLFREAVSRELVACEWDVGSLDDETSFD